MLKFSNKKYQVLEFLRKYYLKIVIKKNNNKRKLFNNSKFGI